MQVVCAKCGRAIDYAGERPLFCSHCGQPLAPPDPEATAPFEAAAADGDRPPERVGGYRLVRRLGSGAMGVVYEAEDPAGGRRVALKLLSAGLSASPEAVERFRREGRLASAISHPRCVFVLAADEDAGRPFIVMELMPGRTLADLVRDEGPLPPGPAVAKILDVIEGLQEAHALGVIHRDVKPSNCFLEEGGRVKVGDFGLAKSLVEDDHLTRTGAFRGTPLFAAPEQVRREAVEQQADVYSAAATLYCLLTGQAPHQTGDALATMARIVSDDAPSLRSLRPGIPPGLERVVLRGLARERGRRWRDLEDFRRALLPFLPGRLSIGSLGLRFGAYLIDSFLVWVAGAVLIWAAVLLRTGSAAALTDPAATGAASADPFLQALGFLPSVVGLLYFGLLEGTRGRSLGKAFLGLRVCRAGGEDAPGLGRALARALVFFALLDLQLALVWLGPLVGFVPPAGARTWGEVSTGDVGQTWAQATFFSLAVLAVWVLGRVLIVCTMRARNGYRGLHEFASGTRVVRLPGSERRRPLCSRLPAAVAAPPRPAGVPERVGSYAVLGVQAQGPAGQVLLGEDPALGRKVWLWQRPASLPPLDPARRDVGRTGRLRWLAGGREGDVQWDAFLAPSGCPLADLIRAEGRLDWPDARPLLLGLAEELAAAEADGTLPPSPGPGQVWVQANGRVLLLDMPAGTSEAAAGGSASEQALELLRRVAVLLLEGRPRRDGSPDPVRAPLPAPAAQVLGRLLDRPGGYDSPAAARDDLEALRDQPAEVTPGRRLWHLTLLAAFLAFGLGCCMMPVSLFVTPAWVRIQTVDFAIDIHQHALAGLEKGAGPDLAAGLAQPDPGTRLAAVARWEADRRLARRLRRNLGVLQEQRRALLQEVGWLMAWIHSWQQKWEEEPAGRAQKQALVQAHVAGRDFRTLARDTAEVLSPSRLTAPDVGPGIGALLVLAFWPAAWVLWAFVARGGFTYRMAGIALVRGDGRPAGRLQCLGRALLVWAPVAGWFLLSAWLDDYYWAAGPARQDSWGWLERLSTACWWAVWLTLAGYFVLALRYPARSLHDRIAGTYLVPR